MMRRTDNADHHARLTGRPATWKQTNMNHFFHFAASDYLMEQLSYDTASQRGHRIHRLLHMYPDT